MYVSVLKRLPEKDLKTFNREIQMILTSDQLTSWLKNSDAYNPYLMKFHQFSTEEMKFQEKLLKVRTKKTANDQEDC